MIVGANRVTNGVQEINPKDFEKSIERQIDVPIPYDLKAAGQAATLGQPIAKAGKNVKITQPLTQIVTMTVAAVDGSEDSGSSSANVAVGGSLLGKFGNFKALMAMKPKSDKATA